MAGHVFISHGSDDRGEAAKLVTLIEGRGVKVWIAPRDVPPGTDYSEQLQAAIEGCAAFAVLVTETANTSPYVRAETEMAFSSGKPIFPIRLADIKPAPGLAFFLKIRHWTDAYGPGRDASLVRLADELRTLTGAGPEPAPEAAPEGIPGNRLPQAAPPPPPSAPADDALRAAAVGPKADYYLAHWAKMAASGRPYDWNWAACLANLFWFAYRKMWLPLVGFIIASILISGLELAGPGMARIEWLSFIGLSFVTGYFGNSWYRKQTDKLIAEAPSLDREARLAYLRARGGVSKPALFAALGIFALLVLIALVGAILQAKRAGPGPGPNPPPAPTLDQAYLVGRWADNGDCSRAEEFTADGRFIAADGGTGVWRLNGDQLTVSTAGEAATITVAPVGQNMIRATTLDGRSATSTRC